ncbi:hypothetical protein HAX54_008909 [Datura stramonium]|uniref:Uncharacterized protein n=1 Tax=Datura stramonium TaxID=4076 RepID=A0ABS8TEW8_DATST|nr:hypothetical protein [Datura stramonium]
MKVKKLEWTSQSHGLEHCTFVLEQPAARRTATPARPEARGSYYAVQLAMQRVERAHKASREPRSARPGVMRRSDNVVKSMKRRSSDAQVGPGFEDPLDDDVSIEDEMARVDSDIESSDDEEEHSEMGEATLAPTDNKE